MKEYILAGFILFCFYSVIGFAVWFTSSAWPLWALLLTPSFKLKD
jgi:hypothetical protein